MRAAMADVDWGQVTPGLTINVRTVYPGAPAELIQGFITTPIERSVAGTNRVAEWPPRSVFERFRGARKMLE